jgi:hypothetical protein
MDIITLSETEIRLLRDELEYAMARERSVRLMFDDGLKVKVGELAWSPPRGEVRPRPSSFDTASSVSRQHYIDTGLYLTHAEVAEWADPDPDGPAPDDDSPLD